jgi:hypothetical protein
LSFPERLTISKTLTEIGQGRQSLPEAKREKAAQAAFSLEKEVGVPADLVLVSTIREMRGLEKPPPSD